MSPEALSGPALEARMLEKWYGPFAAVHGVDFALGRGEFLVLFGPNGAGKSTLLRMLAGTVRATRGTVRVSGVEVRGPNRESRRQIGVLSHQSYLYAGLSAEANLRFYGRLYDLDQLRDRVARALSEVGLWERRSDLVRTFSRGMQQRLALARTLLHEPAIVLLDEPYTGLDPHAARLLRNTLERLRSEQRSVVLVTHNLSQGLELADRVVVQVRGRWISDEPRAGLDIGGWEQEYTRRVAAAA